MRLGHRLRLGLWAAGAFAFTVLAMAVSEDAAWESWRSGLLRLAAVVAFFVGVRLAVQAALGRVVVCRPDRCHTGAVEGDRDGPDNAG